MNTDAKILNKIIANSILKYNNIKNYTTLFQGYKPGSIFENQSMNEIPHINRIQKKSHMMIPIDAETSVEKFNTHL